MGFIIGAVVENLILKDISSDIGKILQQPSKISVINPISISKFYASLIATEPLIIGYNIIDLNNVIIYSDEISLVGTTYSEKSKITKVIENKNFYTVDRNLITQETILKEDYKSLLILFYHFEDIGITLQLLYNLSPKEKEIRQINSLLWFTILLSVGVLFIVLLSISNLTRKTLEKTKRSLEIEVYKRTRELQKLSIDLDTQVKGRTKDLETANKELTQKTNALKKIREKIEYKNYELEYAIKSINKQNKELTKKTLELTELQNKLEDNNYDLKLIKKELEKKNIELQSTINEANKQNKELIRETIELTELRSQLEDKNYELEQANEKVLKLMTSRTEFINKAAHDLRTPITPILLLIPTIKKHIKDKETLYDMEVLERNANYLMHIADSLISYLKSKTAEYKYIFIKYDVRKIIGGVIATYRESFKQHKISIRKKIPDNLPLIEIDEVKITEVIQNIISNALNFMPKGGTITIDVKKMDNYINIKIKDTGIGMSKKTLSKVFEEFYRADESRHITGHGLGLSICRGIIMSHHGKIRVESEGLGKGSTVFFNIPKKQK